MPTILEINVEKRALAWLVERAQARSDALGVTSRRQARTTKKGTKKLGRADGLVASLLNDGYVYTTSLEAKSHKTLKDIIPLYRNGLWHVHAVAAGILIFVIAAAIGYWAGGGWVVRWLIPALLVPFAAFGYVMLTMKSYLYAPIAAIDQIGKYPADERVLALSSAAYNRLRRVDRDELRQTCRGKGVGLLIVRPNKKVNGVPVPHITYDIESIPAKRTRAKAGYLPRYAAAQEMLAKIETCRAMKEMPPAASA